MTHLKRYDIVISGSDYTSNETELADEGGWVRYEDVEAALVQKTGVLSGSEDDSRGVVRADGR